MSTNNRKHHWENVYETKKLTEVGWYQPVPITSIGFVKEQALSKQARIIDIGGGDSFLTDHLLDSGYQNLTVLDISKNAIGRAKKRLGKLAENVQWIVSDIVHFEVSEQYDVWHDRAAFHFLTREDEINTYLETLNKGLRPGGIFIIGTFSDQGPQMCSGLNITQYSIESLTDLLSPSFEKVKCINLDHITPGGGSQNYSFCTFRKK